MHKDLFTTIDTTIRKERIYADVRLMREDVMQRFSISRHHLNDLLRDHAGGLSFPQYINAIRMEKAYEMICNHPEMTITNIAKEVGLTAPNLREQFKCKYGMIPKDYREQL